MLVEERINDIKQRLKIIKVSADENNVTDLYTNRLQQIKLPLTGLKMYLPVLEGLKLNNIEVTLDHEKINALKFRAEEYLVIVKKDIDKIVAPSQTYRKSLLEPLEKFPNTLRKNLEDSWYKYVKKQIPSIDLQFLNVLANVPGLISSVQKIKNNRQSLLDLADTLPQDNSVFAKINNLSNELSKQWEGFGNGMPTTVETFLRKTASHGASLNDLTDEVKAWLSDHNISDDFVIKAESGWSVR